MSIKKIAFFTLLAVIGLMSTSLKAQEASSSQIEFYDGLNLKKLSLLEAQDYLTNHHPKLLSLIALEESSHQVYLQAWSAWLPSINASANFTDGQAPGRYSSALGVNQTLFDSASYWNVRLKKIDWAIAKTNVANLKNELFYELRASYYGLIVASQSVQAAHENVELLQASYKREKVRFELGDTTSFQMNQSKVALAASLADLYAARSNLKKAHQNLFIALGIPPSQTASSLELTQSEIPVNTVHLVKGVLASLEESQLEEALSDKETWLQGNNLFSEEIRQSYIHTALEKSPVVQASRAVINKNTLIGKSRTGEYLPSLSANASYNNSYSHNKNTPFEGRYTGSVGISLEWTLLDGFARERRISQARWDKVAGEEQYRQVNHQTKQSVLGSFYELEQACQTYIASKMGVKLAQEAMDQANHQRTWGVLSPLEYREAASLLTKSKRDLASSSYELIMAYYKLVYNTGEDVAGDYVEIEETSYEAQREIIK